MSGNSENTMVNVRSGHPGSNVNIKRMDLDEMIGLNPCAKAYYSLEECLVDNNREWKRCKSFVKELKQCNDQNKNTKLED